MGVIELNKSPFDSLIYTAQLDRMLQGANLLKATQKKIAPPEKEVLGLSISNADIMLVSETRNTFHVPLNKVLGNNSLEFKTYHTFLTKSEVVKKTFSH